MSAAVTWWGHASVTIETGEVRVALDPLLVGRLFHLRRSGPPPPPRAAEADVVLVSHLHHDHLHLPSLDRFAAQVPVVVPRGAAAAVRGLDRHRLVEVSVGDVVEPAAGVRVEARAAHHDGRRLPVGEPSSPALGFRFEAGGTSVWYPGDTGPFPGLTEGLTGGPTGPEGAPDLAVVPIGGWGPSLGEHHLEPEQAAEAAAAVGARHTLAVHYGTFWPIGLRRLHPDSHRHFFATAAERFRAAADALGLGGVLTPAFGERVELT